MSFLINPKQLEDHFRPVILDRARHYFATGAIRNMAQSENNTWMAEVQGTEVYLVTIKQENSDLCECRCTCPYALEDACKHIAAVLMEIENDENEIQILDEETEEQRTSADSSVQLDKALARSDKSQLAAFIRQVAEFEPHIEHQFLSFMAASDPKTGKAQYRKLVKSALAPARREGLMYGHEARQHLASVYKLLEQADKQKTGGSFRTVLDICQVVVEEMVPALQFIDDSNADVGDAIRWAINLMHDLAESTLDADDQKSFFKWTLKSLKDKRYEGWDFHDDFMAMAVHLAKNDKQIRDTEAILDARIEEFTNKKSDWSSNYNLESAVLWKVHLLKSNDRPTEADEIMDRHKNLTRVRAEMIQTAWDRGKTDTVKSLASEAIETLGKDAPGLISNWQEWLLKVSETEGDENEIIQRLEDLMNSDPKMDIYLKLNEMIPEDQWPPYLRDTLLPVLQTSYRGRSLMPVIFVQEKMWDKLLEYLKKNPDLNLLKRYESFIKETALDEIFELYEQLIRQKLKHNTGRRYYREVCKTLNHVWQLGAKKEVEQLTKELRELYSNRPAFLDEVDKLKY
ncbi:MAG: SWIM zinc finger family protein [Balneolaceae bacterium]|nr:SWIM zinc finger family protein [Balneolaceae bacterium]